MKNYIEKLTGVSEREMPLVIWALIYILSLFLAYYVLRPIRDELGVSNGIENLPWLFSGTLCVMLLISPLFSLIVNKLPRARFISISYRFLSANIIVFSLVFIFADKHVMVWASRAFFIWVSVFNLFAVSIFWSFVVDIFDREKGKRLFGLLSAGATLGGLLGALFTSLLVGKVGHSGLMVIAVIFIEIAVFSSGRLSQLGDSKVISVVKEKNGAVNGALFSGMLHTFRSPYLLGIAIFILLYSITSTFLYYQQATIAGEFFTSKESRTAFFANIDIAVNGLTLIIQIFITGKLIKRFGVILTLGLLPFISIIGFGMLAAYPIIYVLVFSQVVRRVFNFSLARPTRELLFTASSREDRYKAKNFIDTVVYRGGDQAASWGYALLSGMGLTISQLAVIAVPISMLWLFISIWLGKKFNGNSTEV